MGEMDILITIIQTGGLGIFFYFLIKGLYKKIEAMNEVIFIQKQTLETMNTRIQETEKIGLIYKKLLEDLPNDLENYNTIIKKTKDRVIFELSNQKEELERELLMAEEKIKNSDETDLLKNKYLEVLRFMFGKNISDKSLDKDFDLRTFCYHSKCDGEECVKLFFESVDVMDFMKKIGFRFEIYTKEIKTDSIIDLLNEFAANEKEITGCALYKSMGWYIVMDNEIYLDKLRLDKIINEYNILKQL